MGAVGSAGDDDNGQTNNIVPPDFDWMTEDFESSNGYAPHMPGINGECGSARLGDNQMEGSVEQGGIVSGS
jgi:hypothetical protein